MRLGLLIQRKRSSIQWHRSGGLESEMAATVSGFRDYVVDPVRDRGQEDQGDSERHDTQALSVYEDPSPPIVGGEELRGCEEYDRRYGRPEAEIPETQRQRQQRSPVQYPV